MNALIEARPSEILPGPMAPRMDLAVRVMNNKLIPDGLGFEIAVEDAPNDEQRAALQRRVARIDACLSLLSEREVTAEIMHLSASMKKRARSDAEGALSLATYGMVLAEVPGFAVKAACRDFIFGKAGDGWMPEPGDLRSHAMTKVQPWLTERGQIGKLLGATVRPPRTSAEHRRAVVEGELAKLKDMRQAGLDAENARISQEAKFRAEEMRSERERKQAEADHLTARINAGLKDDRPMPKLDPRILAQFPIKQGVSS